MTDTASLKIAINTSDVKTANSELDKLTKTSARTEQSANKVTKSFNLMNTALSSVAAIALAKHFTDSADAMNRLDGRLKLATDSMGEFVRQQHELQKIALDSHAPLQAVTDLFIKLNPSMIRLGANTAATNQVVSNFSKGLTLGGAKAQESASAILQFGQAMGSGVLRGEEFNAIMEASPKLMEYMAKGLGVPIGALRDMAQNGELTAGRVSNALLKMTDQINKDFATLPKTVGLAMVDFNTELDLAIQRIDKATGTTAALSSAINDMAMGLKNGTGALGGTIAFVQDYSDVIMGVATAYGVMKTASIAASLTEKIYIGMTEQSVATIAAKTLALEAEAEAQRLGEYAQNARNAAEIAAKNVKADYVKVVAKSEAITKLEQSAIEAETLSVQKQQMAETARARADQIAKNQMGISSKVLVSSRKEAEAAEAAAVAQTKVAIDLKNKSIAAMNALEAKATAETSKNAAAQLASSRAIANATKEEAVAAEAAALAQTQHAYALRASASAMGGATLASRAMGLALKAIPFVAVASTVAILASSFFDTKNQSDDLADSLSTTADKLAKLSQAQLAFKRQNISLELQDATRQLTTMKLSAGATKGRSVEDQAEIDDLQDYVNQLKDSAKEIAKAQTDIRESKRKIKKEDTKIVPPTTPPPTDKKGKGGKTEAEKEAERIAELQKQLNEDVLKSEQELTLSTLDEFSKRRKQLEFNRDEALTKFKGVKDAEQKIQEIFNNNIAQLNAEQKKKDDDFKLQTDIEANQKRKALLDEEAKLQAENALAMYDQHLKFSLSTFEYDMMKLDEQKEIYLRATEDKLAVDAWYQEQKTALINKEASADVSKSLEPMQTMLDTQISLADSGQDWASSLDGVAGSMADVIKGMSKVNVIGLKADKARIASQEKYAKSFLEANGDIKKEKEAEAEFDNEQNTIKNNQFQNEINAYSDMAGAMAGFFEQGSTGAKAMAIIQGGLAIVSAGAGGDPYTVIPRMIAAAAVVHQALSASGISGGGTSTPDFDTNFDLHRDMIEADYAPMTDRLDRQIDLLEAIERNGSASQLGVELAGSEFMRDYKTWVEDTLEQARVGSVNGAASISELERVASIVESVAGVDIYSVGGGRAGEVELNLSVLREGFNLIDALTATLATGGWGTFGQAGIEDFNSPTAWAQQTGSIRNSINDVQNLINEWALSVVDSMQDLTDAADDFRGYFDDITGSMYYETTRLEQAFDDIDNLRGNSSFSTYLQDTISNIDNLEKFFTDETFALLMSDSLEDIQAQIEAINQLSAVTGETFEGGAREALNYLESIELVAEAMARSRENIASFTSSLMTSEQSSSALATSLGETLATNVDGLAQMFFRLSNDMDGLTDADLELLNANLELLKNTDSLTATQDAYNESLQATQNSISTLNGALGNIQSTIDKLRGAAGGADYTMEMFRQSMSTALSLSGTYNYEDLAKAVQDAAGYSSALMDSSNFEFSRDQKFAQAVAANQFASLEDATLDQIDYLKMIEENTRGQLDILSGSINNLADKINSDLLGAIQGNNGLIDSKYREILGRSADESGISYWANQIASGSIAQSGLGMAIGAAGVENGEITRAKFVEMLYSKGLERTATSAEIDYWANKSSTPTTALASMFAQLEPNFHSFDVGTARVTQDMLAKIHKDEIITPAPMSEGLRNGTLMMGDQSGIIAEMRAMREDMSKLMKVNNEYQEKIDRNTKTSKFAGA